MALVSRSPRDSPPEASSASLARWGGAAVCLGALSYGASGYLDKPDASGFVVGVVLPVLEALTAASFLGGVLGLYYWLGGGGGFLRRAGLLVGSVGAVLGLFDALDWWESDRWIPLYAVLTAVGLEAYSWVCTSGQGEETPPVEGRLGGGLARDSAGPVRRVGLMGAGLVDAAILGVAGGGPRHGSGRSVARPGCRGARVGCTRVGLLAHRPRLLRRLVAHTPATRRIGGLVLLELHSVGSGAFSRGLTTCVTSENSV